MGASGPSIDHGQSLVVGTETYALGLQTDEFDPTGSEVVYEGLGGTTSIEGLLTGGELGALLEFEANVLEPTRRALGSTAIAVTTLINDQNAQGLDAAGQLGSDIFSTGAPRASSSALNSGNASVSVTIEDIGGVSDSEYRFLYDGTNYRLFELATGDELPLTGTGSAGDPFRAAGLAIEVTGSADAGDRFSLEPTIGAVARLDLIPRDGRAFAAAGPLRASGSLSNVSDAAIDNGTVTDITDPTLFATSTIAFLTPTSYSINGGPAIAYADGDPIPVNGAEFRITGTPAAGDEFTITRNTDAAGDNRNALALGETQSRPILRDGTISASQAYSELVGRVGSLTGQAQAGAAAQSIVLESAENRLLSASGVNLDEEAADLVRFQQAYQAAAQVIAVGGQLFDTLLAATR